MRSSTPPPVSTSRRTQHASGVERCRRFAGHQHSARPSRVQQRRDTSRRPRLEARALKLAVRCPWSQRRCRITVRLKAARKTITRKTVMVKGPETVKARLRLPKETRLKLVRRGTLSMTAVIRVRAAGAKLTTRVPLELRAPSG